MSTELEVDYTARYPVKSMAAEEVSLRVTENGIEGDRVYMVIDQNTGQMVTQRVESHMALMVPRLSDDVLTISYKESDTLEVPRDMKGDHLPVTVWGHTLQGIDQGDLAA